jgi:hypothetical protein
MKTATLFLESKKDFIIWINDKINFMLQRKDSIFYNIKNVSFESYVKKTISKYNIDEIIKTLIEKYDIKYDIKYDENKIVLDIVYKLEKIMYHLYNNKNKVLISKEYDKLINIAAKKIFKDITEIQDSEDVNLTLMNLLRYNIKTRSKCLENYLNIIDPERNLYNTYAAFLYYYTCTNFPQNIKTLRKISEITYNDITVHYINDILKFDSSENIIKILDSIDKNLVPLFKNGFNLWHIIGQKEDMSTDTSKFIEYLDSHCQEYTQLNIIVENTGYISINSHDNSSRVSAINLKGKDIFGRNVYIYNDYLIFQRYIIDKNTYVFGLKNNNHYSILTSEIFDLHVKQ